MRNAAEGASDRRNKARNGREGTGAPGPDRARQHRGQDRHRPTDPARRDRGRLGAARVPPQSNTGGGKRQTVASQFSERWRRNHRVPAESGKVWKILSHFPAWKRLEQKIFLVR